jgi:hypothetical protein
MSILSRLLVRRFLPLNFAQRLKMFFFLSRCFSSKNLSAPIFLTPAFPRWKHRLYCRSDLSPWRNPNVSPPLGPFASRCGENLFSQDLLPQQRLHRSPRQDQNGADQLFEVNRCLLFYFCSFDVSVPAHVPLPRLDPVFSIVSFSLTRPSIPEPLLISMNLLPT